MNETLITCFYKLSIESLGSSYRIKSYSTNPVDFNTVKKNSAKYLRLFYLFNAPEVLLTHQEK